MLCMGRLSGIPSTTPFCRSRNASPISFRRFTERVLTNAIAFGCHLSGFNGDHCVLNLGHQSNKCGGQAGSFSQGSTCCSGRGDQVECFAGGRSLPVTTRKTAAVAGEEPYRVARLSEASTRQCPAAPARLLLGACAVYPVSSRPATGRRTGGGGDVGCLIPVLPVGLDYCEFRGKAITDWDRGVGGGGQQEVRRTLGHSTSLVQLAGRLSRSIRSFPRRDSNLSALCAR